MLDLYNKQYSRKELKDNIYDVKLIDIVKTQKIDATFAVRYILNSKYHFHKDDNVPIDILLKYQHHLSLKDIIDEQKIYDRDDDSIDDFSIVAERS
jgi:hypothetical protein